MEEEKIENRQEDDVEKSQDQRKEFVLVQVPTQHTLAVQTPEGDVISQDEALVKILNELQKIKKALV